MTKTDRYAAWVRSIQRPSGQPNINKEEFKSFTTILPETSEQARWVRTMDAARETRRRKLREADDLLGGLDSFVLDQLGLTLPPPDDRLLWAARLGDSKERLDPDYHSPKFQSLRNKIEHGKNTPRTIRSLCDFIQSGFAAGGDAQTDNPAMGVPHIRPLNISNTGELHFVGTKMVPRTAVKVADFLTKNEVLFNNTNSTRWVGKSVVFDSDRECACSNHITRLRLADKKDNPFFFAALLNALRGLGYFGLLSTNFNNQAGINVETLESVRLPWPSPAMQDHIGGEVTRHREQARRLRDEAAHLWEDAKLRFEEELLGSTSSANVSGSDTRATPSA